jgi:hypothetical protein
MNVMGTNPFGPPVQIIPGVRQKECQALMQEFFKKLRQSE